ncbi:hypothetical protein F2P56_018746 [Juglans regia]|uniref:Uncharacterized protein n=2 Tax=Juglans regia TaxID=51240 RepID=A0A833UYP8_JUGRE|nr:uncharacterized protein LOC108997853 [Juglans regia]KAF5462765.1 hypothetical protein F2P56_018746 [Juglans regia]
MGISPDRLHLHLVAMPLKGFIGDVIQPVGAITLSVLAEKAPRQLKGYNVNFQVVNALSSYNTILGRPTLNNLKVIMSTYHLKMKFPTSVGVGEIKGEQVLTRDCYAQELKTDENDVRTLKELTFVPKPPLPSRLAEQDEETWDE